MGFDETLDNGLLNLDQPTDFDGWPKLAFLDQAIAGRIGDCELPECLTNGDEVIQIHTDVLLAVMMRMNVPGANNNSATKMSYKGSVPHLSQLKGSTTALKVERGIDPLCGRSLHTYYLNGSKRGNVKLTKGDG